MVVKNFITKRGNLVNKYLIAIGLAASAWILYSITFICTPNLIHSETIRQVDLGDLKEYADTIRGKFNETDARKHLLYFPIARFLYLIAYRLTSHTHDDILAIIFPNAVCGAIAIALAYLVFASILNSRCVAISVSVFYALSWVIWFYSSVPESYALTTAAVNLFFLFAFSSSMSNNIIWRGLILGVLAAVCGLCDLRYTSICIVAFSHILLTNEIAYAKRLGVAVASLFCTLLLMMIAYQLVADELFGLEDFGVLSMLYWLRHYGSKYSSINYMLDPYSNIYVIISFFVSSITPLYPEFMGGFQTTAGKLHIGIWCLFVLLLLIILGCSFLEIIKMIKKEVRKWLGVIIWLLAMTLWHFYYDPKSAPLFAVPILFPYLACIMPGVIRYWLETKKQNWRFVVLLTFVAIVFINNFLLIFSIRQMRI